MVNTSYIRRSTVTGLLFALTVSAFATFINPPRAKADTLTVIPPKFELFGNPGDTISEKIKVRNDGTEELSYQAQVEDFRAAGDDGSIDLAGEGVSNETYSLASWITADPKRFTIRPGEEKVVSVNIRVPRNGEPGGHYASVLIKRAGQDTQGGASVDTRIGSLILLRVSGNVTEKLRLEQFKTEDSFMQYGPVKFDMRFINEGNVHIAPTGTIVITNLFGKKVKEFPFTPANVLPGAARIVDAEWDQKNLVGRYTASLVVNYGQNKQTIAASTSFIVFPLYLLAIGFGLITILVLALNNRKKLKKIINRLTTD